MSPSGPVNPDARQARRLVAGLVIALALWGIYLAIGATGIFIDAGLLDLRKSWIVLGCSAAFLAFWLGILRLRARRTDLPRDDRLWNWPSGLSLAGALLGMLLWLAAGASRQPGGSVGPSYTLGSLAAGLLAISAILALVGASDPRPRRGKLLALLTLLLLGTAVMVFLGRSAIRREGHSGLHHLRREIGPHAGKQLRAGKSALSVVTHQVISP